MAAPATGLLSLPDRARSSSLVELAVSARLQKCMEIAPLTG
jgi:hypothetical protein